MHNLSTIKALHLELSQVLGKDAKTGEVVGMEAEMERLHSSLMLASEREQGYLERIKELQGYLADMEKTLSETRPAQEDGLNRWDWKVEKTLL